MSCLENVYQTVTDMIEEVETTFAYDYTPHYWENDDGEEINLREYLEEYFEHSSFVYKYSIEDMCCFRNSAYECGVLSIAFTTIENELGHIVIEWEEN